ncbi:hypothetical protein ACWDZ4_04280 [Streptomyces sp. NPDC003016]
MPIDPYAALNAMLRAEVARSSDPSAVDPSPERHEPQQCDRGGESGGEEGPTAGCRP